MFKSSRNLIRTISPVSGNLNHGAILHNDQHGTHRTDGVNGLKNNNIAVDTRRIQRSSDINRAIQGSMSTTRAIHSNVRVSSVKTNGHGTHLVHHQGRVTADTRIIAVLVNLRRVIISRLRHLSHRLTHVKHDTSPSGNLSDVHRNIRTHLPHGKNKRTTHGLKIISYGAQSRRGIISKMLVIHLIINSGHHRHSFTSHSNNDKGHSGRQRRAISTRRTTRLISKLI